MHLITGQDIAQSWDKWCKRDDGIYHDNATLQGGRDGMYEVTKGYIDLVTLADYINQLLILRERLRRTR